MEKKRLKKFQKLFKIFETLSIEAETRNNDNDIVNVATDDDDDDDDVNIVNDEFNDDDDVLRGLYGCNLIKTKRVGVGVEA